MPSALYGRKGLCTNAKTTKSTDQSSCLLFLILAGVFMKLGVCGLLRVFLVLFKFGFSFGVFGLL
jgi:hypothetical protein